MTDWFSEVSAPQAEPGTDWYRELSTPQKPNVPRGTNEAENLDASISAMEADPYKPSNAPVKDFVRPSITNDVASKMEPSAWEKVKNLFSGADRETRATQELPELVTSGLLSGEDKATLAKITPVLLVTTDPVEQANIIHEAYPHIGIQQDEKGNMILGNSRNGVTTMVNKPGGSGMDVLQAGGLMAEYTPAGKLGAGGTSMIKGMLKVGSGSAATETANQAAQAATGGEFDKTDVAIAGVGGAAFEGIGVVLAKAFKPMFSKAGEITPEMRDSFKEAARSVGIDPEQITDDLISSYMQDVTRATRGTPSGEFNIRYTQGQQSGEAGQLMLEDTLRKGNMGKARDAMKTFENEQASDIMAARENLAGTMGTGKPVSPYEAAENVMSSVKNKAEAAQAATDQAYAQVGKASLKPEGQVGSLNRLKRTAKSEQFVVDKTLTPSTKKALDEIDSYLEAYRAVDESGGAMKELPLRRVETFRKRLNAYIDSAPNKTDKRQVTIMKRQFDDYLNKAIDRALFTGDQEALNQLKNARQLHADYMKTFTQQDVGKRTGGAFKDDAGALIQRMVEYDPSPQEVVNFFFGVNTLGGRASAAKAVKKLGEILGKDSEEFTGLTQAAFLHMTDPGKNQVFSATKFKTNLANAYKKNPDLMNALFTPEQKILMQRYADAVEKAQPSIAEYGNVSRSGHKLAEYAAQTWERMILGLGFAKGGPLGAVAAKGGIETVKAMKGNKAYREALDAINQAKPLQRINMAPAVAPAIMANPQEQK